MAHNISRACRAVIVLCVQSENYLGESTGFQMENMSEVSWIALYHLKKVIKINIQKRSPEKCKTENITGEKSLLLYLDGPAFTDRIVYMCFSEQIHRTK